MDVYFLKNNNQDLAFFPETIKFLKIDTNTKNLHKEIKNNATQKKICSKYKLEIKNYNDLMNKINEYAISKENNNESKIDTDSLNKLVLNVSNACNLKCKYCYASGGTYGSEKKLMTKDTAKCAIDLFFYRFKKIKYIQIFGGEPLLNFPVMKFICEYLHEKFDRDEIEKVPGIGLVTNGTLISDEFVDLINKYDISVTFSFDGTPETNDAMRIFRDDSPTSNVILKNLKILKEKTGEPNLIEVTYNKSHIENNVSIKDIVSFIKNIDKNIDMHITPVVSCNKSENEYALNDLTSFIDSVDDLLVDNKSELYSLLQRYILAIQNKTKQKYICRAGSNMFSVSASGDIYPCFMFTDNNDFCIGNISDENVLYSKKFNQSLKKFCSYDKRQDSECRNCFIRNICFGCLGQNLCQTGDAFKTDRNICNMNRAIVEKILIKMSQMEDKKNS